jgi:hypothetical protein
MLPYNRLYLYPGFLSGEMLFLKVIVSSGMAAPRRNETKGKRRQGPGHFPLQGYIGTEIRCRTGKRLAFGLVKIGIGILPEGDLSLPALSSYPMEEGRIGEKGR